MTLTHCEGYAKNEKCFILVFGIFESNQESVLILKLLFAIIKKFA